MTEVQQERKMSGEKTRPTERAMRAAVEMEIHAACSTTTLSKGHEIDRHFPGYDDMLAALQAVRARFQHLRLGPDEDAVIDRVDAAIAKAEDRK